MSSLLRKYWYLTVVALLLFSSASFAQTTTLTLTTAGDGATVGGVYVDPYTATIGLTSVPVVCDDWSNNTYIQETWTANVATMTSSGLPSGAAPMFGNNSTLYNEVAWLATQLMTLPNTGTPTIQAEISFALWDLTYGANGTNQETPSPLAYLAAAEGYAETTAGFNACLAAQNAVCVGANTYLTEAENEGSFNASGWSILTPNTNDSITCSGSPCPSTPPQEFLVETSLLPNGGPIQAPESSTVILLGADMFGLLGLAFVYRRRLIQPNS